MNIYSIQNEKAWELQIKPDAFSFQQLLSHLDIPQSRFPVEIKIKDERCQHAVKMISHCSYR